MKSYELPFAEIIILKDNFAEVIIKEGVVMDEFMVGVYHDFLLTHLQAPFALLINKKNSYSYTFEAQKTIADLKEISHMAVVVATNGALMSTETLIKMNEDKQWNIRLFQERDVALNWLNSFVTV
ncbi:hypothetical protein KO566_03530 [Flavobacteriaceae bacterium XHP0103]|uniref:hypothetical protein n=1 Tax=Marixanthotalea marina TaxID=2844359 RepID=UPI002989C3AA|nr:hypothetical protein [Marixanthotalea marina]MBU3821120.1 hypothetical protein [Marixanthotalea marina]